ncbi:sulfotransferase family 2 domain-containing protein [Priestia aryabhattai]|uniref:sulfotransferase family 2 domain-containing protein n=1 Tax=Priestia aryabhattai TaxID=412384 RepID=UPI0015931088
MSKKQQEKLIADLTTHTLPLYEKDFPLIFFWSPKSGCTSLIKWFFFQVGVLQKAMDYNPWVHFYRMEVYENSDDHIIEIRKQLSNEKKDVYKLVRNPYKRAVSSFLATLGNESIMNQVAPNKNGGLSFKEFLYHVKNIGVSKDLINNHIAQQYIEGEELLIENYVKLEDFSDSMRNIESKYKLLNSPILSLTRSSHHVSHRMQNKGGFADIKMTIEVFNNPMPTYESFYDDETKNLVENLFAKDFEKYKYNKDDLNRYV